nr:F-box domain, leucine-rich repeat domain, L domain-like protein [Tanacetum cinerariifolium]
MESPDWTEINAGIQQHLQKTYDTNKAAFKAHHWVIDPTTGTYNVEKIRQADLNHSGIPSPVDTFFVAHTVNGEFLRDEDRHIYEEMRRLEATGTYTNDEINRFARGGKQRGHIPGVGRVLPARATANPKVVMSLYRFWYRSFPGDMSPGNMCHRDTYFLIGKYVRPIVSPRIVVGEGIPYERSRTDIPWRQVARETYLQ